MIESPIGTTLPGSPACFFATAAIAFGQSQESFTTSAALAVVLATIQIAAIHASCFVIVDAQGLRDLPAAYPWPKTLGRYMILRAWANFAMAGALS